jgi:hypothetical protein
MNNYLDCYVEYLLERVNRQRAQLAYINSVLGQNELKEEQEDLIDKKGCD